jgi:photosystem II stability/assembly factor-like uncharacterized protein
MKLTHRRTLVSFTLIAILATAFILYNKYSQPEFEREGEEGEENEKQSGVRGQMESWWQARAYPDPTYLNDKWWAAWEHEQALRTENTSYNEHARITYGAWTNLGPNNGPGGRILTIAVNPTTTSTVWAGSASGGLWKSTNGATNWSYVPTNLPLLGVSSIIISSANSNVMYAGTGEVYRVDTSNIGFNVWKGRGTYGVGIIKSTDGGVTWTQSLTRSTSMLFGIQKLRFSNTSDNTVFACATDGLYRTTDAGANWTNIAPGKIYVTDVIINSADPNQMMIAVGNLTNSDKGIYRTLNGTSVTPTWTKLTSGMPASFGGLVRFAYASGNTVVASFSNGSGGELRRSTNFGTGWTALTPNTSFTSYQFWCTNAIEINPSDPNTLILGGVSLYRYTVSTQTRTTIGANVHSDIHDIAYDPVTPATFYVACDGGVYKTTNSGGTFAERNTGLGATQFYASFGVSSSTANYFIGGLQDNGAMKYNGSTWTTINWLGGDGTACAIHPTNNNIQLASRDARGIYRTSNGGTAGGDGGQVAPYWGFDADSRTAFVAPLAFAKSDPTRVYCASDVIHISNDAGATFTNPNYGAGVPPTTPNNHIEQRHKTAIALAVSPYNHQKLYVSTSPFAQYDNDVNNLYINPPPGVRRSTNGGATTPFTNIKSNLPDRFVMDFAISPTNDDSVWVALGGYGTSHIYVTGNGGGSWTDVGAGLPDVPFNAILIDADNPRFLYAGSDMGVYVSNNRGLNWFSYSGGFQDVIQVFDLQITADDRLVAATHGRGIWISNLATNAPLPVNILEFTGQHKGTYNELKWKVSEERNVSHYELERRMDNGAYASVARINARNGSGILTYTHDDNISNASGTNFYYRLKIVDVDGSIKYSAVVFLKVQRPGSMEIMGNPVTPNSSVRLTLPSPQRVLFKVFDVKGSLVHTSTVDASAGANIYPFSKFGFLAAGHYTMQAITNTERFSKRIIVK